MWQAQVATCELELLTPGRGRVAASINANIRFVYGIVNYFRGGMARLKKWNPQ